MRFLIVLLLLAFCSPCFAQEEYSAPTRESYDFERLAREAALVLYVDVTSIDAARSGKMILGGEGSVVDFLATVREALKGEVVASDVVIRAVGHKFFQSGRLLVGPALFFVKASAEEKAGRPVYEIIDPFGKFFLKSYEADEVGALLASAERAVERVEPVREGDPSLAPPEKKRKKKSPVPVANPDAPEPSTAPAAEPSAEPSPAPAPAPSPAPKAKAVPPAADPVGDALSTATKEPAAPAERPVQILEETEEELTIEQEPAGK